MKLKMKEYTSHSL